MTDQLIDSLLDRLTPEQCVEMQSVVETYDEPFEHFVTAVKGASPEVLNVLTVTLSLPNLLKGEAVSQEVGEMLPKGFLEQLWRSQHRTRKTA